MSVRSLAYKGDFLICSVWQKIKQINLLISCHVRLSILYAATFEFASFNSQAPDVPELAHRGIFRLSRLSVNSYLQTVKKYYP